jgi:NADH-quinone oxidoreductase subunit M
LSIHSAVSPVTAIGLFPQVAAEAWVVIAGLATVGIIYGALVAMVQPDLKKLVAYSSVSHMGFVLLGLFALNQQGVTGSIYQMLNHGLSTGALVLAVGMIYHRRHTRLIADFGGLWQQLPRFSVVFLIVMLSSIGLPGLNGFVGEFLILLGAFETSRLAAAIGTIGIILGAVYMLWMFQRVFYGAVRHQENATLPDLLPREWASVIPLCAMALVMGIFPNIFLAPMEASVQAVVQRVQASRTLQVDATATPGPHLKTRIQVVRHQPGGVK